MAPFIARRLLIALPTLLGVVTLAFLMIRLAPGDPAEMLLGDYGALDARLLADLRADLGLDRPLHVQYGVYLRDVLSGDLGLSFRTERPVLDEIAGQLPFTLMLTAAGVLFAVALGVPAGILAALRRDTWLDVAATTLAMVWVSTPSFWFGILLIYLFAFGTGWFPVFGAGRLDDPGSLALHLVLPATAVGARSAALIARMARAAMLDVLGSDYVRTARAKGLAVRAVIGRHALRTAAIPILTVVGLDVAYLLSGSVVIETVFARPGLGKLVVDAVYARDYATVQGALIVFAVFVMAANLLTDLAYAWIDPRIRYA